MKKTMGAIAMIAIVGAVLATYAALTSSHIFSNSTGVLGVGVSVYSDSGCNNALTNINWGMLSPGQSATFPIWVKNTGTTSATLTMAAGNWNPSTASGNFTVTWNRQSYNLTANSVVAAVLTLGVSSNAAGMASVTFDITITGTH